MTLIRWNAYRPVTSIDSALGDRLRHFFEDFDKDFPADLARGFAGSFRPATDLVEREGEYEVSMELAGVDPKDVSINVEDDRLTVSGEKKFVEEKNRDGVLSTERVYGSFTRSFALPRNVNREAIQAWHENGVLLVTVPKSEEAKSRRIEIKAN